MTSDTKPKKKKLRVRKKELTRQAILEAAEEFFSKNPMDEVNLEDIAEAAVVSRTTLYNYFKNKDAIFFGLGIQLMNDTNTYYEETYPDDRPGKEQVLELCRRYRKIGRDRPLIYAIVREFYMRINSQSIPLREMKAKILKSRGSPRFENLLETSEEPYLIEFYAQLLRYTDVWTEVIKKGKSDGSITNDLDDIQIALFIFMLNSGMEGEMNLRRATLGNIEFDKSNIIENTLDLIASFLKK
ncbi:MAG: TetR/AcrR family transcriptional regulator [Promethearchaeota archaeon]